MTGMSFLEHLEELRRRIIYSFLYIVAGFSICWWFHEQIFGLMQKPIVQALANHGMDTKLVYLNPTDAFNMYLKVAFLAGVFVASPFVLYQVWAFISPGLTPEERRIIRPWVPVALLMFAIGVIVAWVVLPFALAFLFSFESDAITIQLTIDNYFGFITMMFLAFGLTMQFPIVLYILSRIGIVTSARLKAARRYVILGIAVFATVITPGGDLVSPTVLGVTMYVLFEISIFVIGRSGR